MKFRDKETGKVFDTIEAARKFYCYGRELSLLCGMCPIKSTLNGTGKPCSEFCEDNEEKAAKLIGYEIIEDKKEKEYGTTADEAIDGILLFVRNLFDFDEVNKMTNKAFNKFFEEQIERSRKVLCKKAEEYATEDRLHNFRVAAKMQDCDEKKALAGMMAKHTVSIYDMCISGKDYPIELWEEKITDHINYLLLLNAIVRGGK